MTCYTELCACFKQDDYQRLPELIRRYNIVPVVTTAAAYSTKQQKISPRMARVILQALQGEVEMYHAIWVLDELINGDNHLFEKVDKMQSMQLVTIMRGINRMAIDKSVFRMVREEVLLSMEQPSNNDPTGNRGKLIEYIGTCASPEFCKYLHFICEEDAVVVLSDAITLATLERARRVLDDDRAFFLTLRSATVESAFDQMIAASEASQEEIMRLLQEQGYEVEKASEDAEVYFARAPRDTQVVNETTEFPSTYNPNSGTAWVAEHSRRGYGRRRRR